MITSELISYIEKQIQNNVAKDIIISKLINAGWRIEDINEGFLGIDKYREPIEGDNIFSLQKEIPGVEFFDINGKKQELKIEESPKIEPVVVKDQEQTESPATTKTEIEIDRMELPAKEELKTESAPAIQDFKKIETPAIKTTEIEIDRLELPAEEKPAIEQPKVEVINIPEKEIPASAPTIETPKIEIKNIEFPKSQAPVVKISEVKDFKIETPEVSDIYKKEIPKTEAPKVWTPMSIPVKEITKAEQSSINTPDFLANQNKEGTPISNFNLEQPKEVDYFTKKEELIPTINPKTVVNPFDSIKMGNSVNQNFIPTAPTPSNDPIKNSIIQNLPKVAMLSSFQKDALSASQLVERNDKPNRSKIKWIIIGILAVVLVGVAAWALTSGYINIPFIKKDPRVLLLDNSKTLSNLKSYKTETAIEITSPSFANISAGLLTGEAISSPDKDSVSIDTLGIINKGENGVLSDNFITIKSSVLEDYIVTDVKNDGSSLFVSVPDLSQITKEKIPESSAVKINEQEFSLIPDLFSEKTATLLKKINIYNLLSSSLTSYVNKDVLSAYNELINNVEITEKGEENIKGIDTYHYLINTDRQLAKSLLNEISHNLTLNLSDGDEEKLTEILGAVTVDSFDVWVGKGDNNIYQYNVVLGVPLSKIIGFEDKSIGDNKVNISWKTTYYDFNIPNNVLIPDSFTTASDFANQAKIEKMKDSVSSFKALASSLAKAEVSYGSKSNPTGSCMSPVSGSLFSPLGHTTKATIAVSAISSLLNNILGQTGGEGSCYSTPKAWSFTVPISSSYDPNMIPEGGYTSFFCADSTGAELDLPAPATSVVCSKVTEVSKTVTQ